MLLKGRDKNWPEPLIFKITDQEVEGCGDPISNGVQNRDLGARDLGSQTNHGNSRESDPQIFRDRGSISAIFAGSKLL